MYDYDLVDSDYSEEDDTFNEDYFITHYLDNMFDLYYDIRNSVYYNPTVMGKSSITSFTTLMVDLLFNQPTTFKKYGKTLSYRENRFLLNNKQDIDNAVDSIYSFIRFIINRYGTVNVVSKDLLNKWVVKSSYLSRL